MPTDDSPVSIVEDLDPHPAPRKDKVEVRELLLGLLLVVAVLGWAVWQSQQQDSTAAQYRMGQQAEKERNWSEALSHYSAASGYPGAVDGVTRVRRAIDGLQEHIISARWYAQEGQWASALLSVQSAGAIDPDFGNLASIAAESKSHVYSQALLGAVALREVGGQRALYYRSATEWVRLPDSDGLSRVLASDSGTRFVYDVPVQWCTPEPVTPPPTEEPQSPADRLKNRRLAVALFDGAEPRFYQLSTDMNAYPEYKIGQRGVWGIPGGRTVRGDQSDMFSFEWPLGEPVGYQGFGSMTVTPLQLPGPDWVILQVEARPGRALLADLTDGIIRVCVSSANGYNPFEVYSSEGALRDFLVSPGGRYAVLVLSHRINDPVQQESAVLLDLPGPNSPRVLVESDISDGASNPQDYFTPKVFAGFLNEGMLAGKVLATNRTADATTLSIIDPARPGEPPITGTIPGAPALTMQVNEVDSAADDAWPVITWVKDSGGASPLTGEVVAARFAPGRVAVTRTLALQPESAVMPVGVRGDHLIWMARKRAVNVDGTAGALQPLTFYSLPLGGLDEPRPQPTAFFSQPVPNPPGSSDGLGSTVSLGPDMLAYIQGTDLRARTYDGAVDVFLESGVIRFEGSTWPDVWPAR